MIRCLSDGAYLLFVRISGVRDTGFTAKKLYYVIDLRPTEFTIAVENECPSTAGSQIIVSKTADPSGRVPLIPLSSTRPLDDTRLREAKSEECETVRLQR